VPGTTAQLVRPIKFAVCLPACLSVCLSISDASPMDLVESLHRDAGLSWTVRIAF